MSGTPYFVPSYLDASSPDNWRRLANTMPHVGPLRFAPAVGSYTVSKADLDWVIKFTDTGDLYVPADAELENERIPIGAQIAVLNASYGRVRINPADGVTIVSGESDRFVVKKWKVGILVKTGANFWLLSLGQGSGGGTNTVPLPPVLKSCFGVSGGVYVGWVQPTDDGGSPLTQYILERSQDGTNWVASGFTQPDTPYLTVDGLNPGTSYAFRVKAINAIGASEPSNVLSASPTTEYTFAKGGTVSTFQEGGRTYRLHTFTQDGTFEVVRVSGGMQLFMHAAGGNGGADWGSGGGGGGAIYGSLSPDDISANSYVVKVGGISASTSITLLGGTIVANPGGTGGNKGPGGGGGTANAAGLAGLTAVQGGTGGGPGPAAGSGGFTYEFAGRGVLGYCGGGGGGWSNQSGGGGGAGVNGGGGGGGYSGSGQAGEAGGPGVRGGGGGGASIYSYGNAAGGAAEVNVWYETNPYNEASGGEVIDYSDGQGNRWRAHRFTSSGTFTVLNATNQFRAMVLGGGAGGGYGTGGGRGEFNDTMVTLQPQSYTITVGNAVAGGYDEVTNRDAPGNNGQRSAIEGVLGSNGGVSRGAIVGPGSTTNITGVSVTYGGSGGADDINNDRNIGGYPGGGLGGTTGTAAPWVGGGGGGGQWHSGGGNRGEVVIAYRIKNPE